MEILGGQLLRNETNERAMGGTELIATAMAEKVHPDLLKHFQIIHSRVRNLAEDKLRILVLHDLPGDPEADVLKNGGYNHFHKLVFVSNWQMQQYIAHYGIPWHKCVVIENAIEPIQAQQPSEGPLKLIYHTTPHRGLELLVPVFEKLAERHDIELDVFSSFKVYGWEQRDAPYEDLFDRCRAHPKINYHGSVPNAEVKVALSKAHIFAYPSIWLETSCISLMEAMSAGCLCVHPNYGALYETAGGMTMMYQWQANARDHSELLRHTLEGAIQHYAAIKPTLVNQQTYAALRYNWTNRAAEWNSLLASMLKTSGRKFT